MLSFACTWLAVGAILLTALRTNRGGTLSHVSVSASLAILLLFDPVVIASTGKTWNHEVPAFLLIVAVLAHLAASRRDSLRFMALSGLACGLAVGTRLTFLPCLLPLAGSPFFFPLEGRRRWTMAITFSAAATVALAPSLYFFATSPESFIFGNLEFPRLRLLDPTNDRIRKTMTIWRKVRYFAKEIVLPSWPIFVAFAVLALSSIRRRLALVAANPSGARTVALVALFLLIGCFLPSRYQYQHFFALIPLLVLGLALVSDDEASGYPRVFTARFLLVFCAASSLFTALYKSSKGESPLPEWAEIFHRETWFPSRAAEFGAELRSHVDAGRILTLAPTWPVAGGLKIYPEFATGPFAWRSARFVSPERRRQFHLIAPDDLEELLSARPPAGILTGVEDDDLEAPLVAYARAHGFTAAPLSRKRVLWLPRQ